MPLMPVATGSFPPCPGSRTTVSGRARSTDGGAIATGSTGPAALAGRPQATDATEEGEISAGTPRGGWATTGGAATAGAATGGGAAVTTRAGPAVGRGSP